MKAEQITRIFASLVCFLIFLIACPGRSAGAQALPEAIEQTLPQTDAAQTDDIVTPAPAPASLTAVEIESRPSETFKLSILLKNSAGAPAAGANVLIARHRAAGDEAPAMLRTDDDGRAVVNLADAKLAFPPDEAADAASASFSLSAAWIDPQGGMEYLQTIAEFTADQSEPVEWVVTARLASVETNAPTDDIRTNPCYVPGQVNTHLIHELWGATDYPEKRREDQMQIGELNALLPAPNQALFALATNHVVSLEALLQLGLGPVRTGTYDVEGSGAGAEYTSGWLNNGIFDIYATVEVIPRTLHYRCYAIPPADPNLFYLPVDREEIRVNRIMGITPKKRERYGVLEIQSNYLSFAIVERDYACSRHYLANFTVNPANEIPWSWSYQSNRWYYWQNEGNLSLGPISMGVRFKGGSGTTTQVTHRYSFRRSSDSGGPSVWWAYSAVPGECDLSKSVRVMITHDRALQNACGLPWTPPGLSSMAAVTSDGALSLPADVCSLPLTPEPLPYMPPPVTVTPTPQPSTSPATPTRTATPTTPPSGNLPAPDVRGGQLPNSTDWRLYLNNWNDVMTNGRYVTYINNPPDWQDPDPNSGCLTVSVAQPSSEQPSAPQAACWPRDGELDVACGSRLEAKTFDGSGNSSPVGMFTTGACPSTPTPVSPPPDTGWAQCYAGCSQNPDGTYSAGADGQFVLQWGDPVAFYGLSFDGSVDYQVLENGSQIFSVQVGPQATPGVGGVGCRDTGFASDPYRCLRFGGDGAGLPRVPGAYTYQARACWHGTSNCAAWKPDSPAVILVPAPAPTPSATAPATRTPTATSTRTATPTVTATPIATPTRTATPIFTPTATATAPPLATVYTDAALGSDNPTCGASAGAAACKTIGYALAQRAAAGGTVSVAAGTYTERITLRPGVKVLGAGAAATTLNGGGGGPVVTADGAAITSSTVLAGFTITGGNAELGGGLYIVNGAAPIIEQNVIQGNSAGRGGAIYTESASPTIRSNTLRDNMASVFGGAVQTTRGTAVIQGNAIENNTADWGGGLFVDIASATVSGNTIRGNTASGGGGILIYNAAACAITNNLIEGNHASATEPMGGGGLNIDVAASPVLTGNIIRNNTGLAGGGINLGASGLGSPGVLTAHSNILCGNEGHQFYNETTATPDLTGNWWGTNAPGATEISGPAAYSPAIALSVSASPANVVVPGASTLQASMQGGGHTVPDGTTITWRTTLGTLNPASSGTTGGLAQTGLSSAAAGTAGVIAADACGYTAAASVIFDSAATPTPAPTATRTHTPASATATPTRTPTPTNTSRPSTATPTSAAATTVTLQQGASGYSGTTATYFDASGSSYNMLAYLRVDNTGSQKSLLRFNLASIPSSATVQAATLSLYWYGSSNGNSLTAATHRVLADWVDSQATRTQRKTGTTWAAVGMAAGSDYAATAAGTAALSGAAGKWVNLDVTALVQQWVRNPATNYGFVLLSQAASGSVTASFCSELRWSPCVNPPKLTVTYRP